MTGPNSMTEAMARDAAERIAKSRELAEQLTLLPDEAKGAQLVDDGKRGRGPGKVLNQMREFLAARGYRMPEDVLAEMAGLASRDDTILTAMVQAERVLSWAGEGSVNRVFRPGVGHVELVGPWQPTPDQKLAVFQQVYALMLRAAEAMMPYGMPKLTPDTSIGQQVNTIIVQGAPQAAVPAGQTARDVTPGARRIGPPPMPGEMQRNQSVSGEAAE